MSKGKDLKKHFEAIVGRELSIDPDRVIVLRQPVSVYSRESVMRVFRDIGFEGAETKGCAVEQGGLDVSGLAATGADGDITFRVSDFHCDRFIAIEHPVNFVATARSSTPVFLTAEHTVLTAESDVKITVRSWKPNGEPAPSIRFDWRCRIPTMPIVT